MATNRLTWQNVTAPDFTAAASTQRYATEALDKALGRVSGAISAFDNNRKDAADAAVLRNAMQYQNADELQRAIASGQLMNGVNPDHVRVDALLKAQQQAGQLLALDKDRQQLATSQQTFDFNAGYNPLRLERAGLENTQLGYDIKHTQGERERADQARMLNDQINMEVAEKFRTGEFQDPRNVAAWVQQGGSIDSPEGLARWNAALKHNPALGQTFEQMGIALPQSTDSSLGSIGAPTTAAGSVNTDKLFDSLLTTESNNRQHDAKGNVITSPKGATGIAQVMPATGPEAAKLAGLPWDETRFKQDAEYNKALGRAYFNKQLSTFGDDPAKALAAYNAGPGALQGAIAKAEKAGQPANWLSFLPKETQDYVSKTLNRLGATSPQAQQEAGAMANQAMLAVVDGTNRRGVPLNQQFVSALQMGIKGEEDVSLRGTLARHKDAFSGINSDQLEKMLTEINQKTGNTGNFEFAVQFLKNLPTETLGGWRDWVPGVRGSGKHFDPSQIQAAVDAFNAEGGIGLYNGAAAGYRANAALENQATNQKLAEDLTTRRQAALKAVQAGVPNAQAQLTQIEQLLEAAQDARNTQSRATYGGFIPAELAAQAQRAAASPTAPAAPANEPAANNFYSTAAVEQRKATQLLREQAQAAAKEKNPTEAPRRLADTSRLVAQREKVKELTTDRIRAMSQAEAREVISQGLFPLLSPEKQKLLRSKT